MCSESSASRLPIQLWAEAGTSPAAQTQLEKNLPRGIGVGVRQPESQQSAWEGCPGEEEPELLLSVDESVKKPQTNLKLLIIVENWLMREVAGAPPQTVKIQGLITPWGAAAAVTVLTKRWCGG